MSVPYVLQRCVLRRCVYCKESSRQSELFRISFLKENVKEVGKQERMLQISEGDALRIGRGAYVHKNRECLDGSLNEKILSRAFRQRVDRRQVAALLEASREIL